MVVQDGNPDFLAGPAVEAYDSRNDVLDAVSRLEGIRCGSKETSCPDQLARVLKFFQ